MAYYTCALCGNEMSKEELADESGICPVCDWTHDPVQEEDPDYIGGANNVTLNEAKADWEDNNKSKADVA